jgi:hypothetical protein
METPRHPQLSSPGLTGRSSIPEGSLLENDQCASILRHLRIKIDPVWIVLIYQLHFLSPFS